MGTYNEIATARHCLPESMSVSFRGHKKEQLQNFNMYVSGNPNIDLAFIEIGEPFIYNEGALHVLDNVLVIGYPKVAFFDFL